jgi:hypothetical protein
LQLSALADLVFEGSNVFGKFFIVVSGYGFVGECVFGSQFRAGYHGFEDSDKLGFGNFQA